MVLLLLMVVGLRMSRESRWRVGVLVLVLWLVVLHRRLLLGLM
jgi:hypothetical protein